MVVVVPIKDKKDLESKITRLNDSRSFAFLYLNEKMQIEKVEFKPTFENEIFDYFITCDKSEDLDSVFDLGARVLLAFNGVTLDEIVEGMMFRELDEIS
jgi:hypothetical protein